MDTLKHDNAYQWDCRACIHDARAPGDNSLFEEHVADVRLHRDMANPSEGAKRLAQRPGRPRHRRHPRAR